MQTLVPAGRHTGPGTEHELAAVAVWPDADNSVCSLQCPGQSREEYLCAGTAAPPHDHLEVSLSLELFAINNDLKIENVQ